MRGLIGGMIVGGLVSVVALGFAGLAIEPVTLKDLGLAPDTQAPADDPAPQPDADAPEAGQTPDPDADMPVAAPDGAAQDGAAEDTQRVDEAGDVAASQTPQPDTPQSDTPQPDASQTEMAVAEETPLVAPETEASAIEAPTTDVPETAAPVTETPTTETPVTTSPATVATDETEAPVATAPPVVVAPGTPDTGETELVVNNVVVTAPQPAPEDRPQPPGEVVTDRLPRIGDAAETPAPTDLADVPAIDRNAINYTPVAGLPEMAIVLLDAGPDRANVGDLAMMPFPLSIAVDASAVDAEAAVAFYRAAGAEVLLRIPLPPGATPTDVDVTFQVYESLLDQVVGVMFDPEAGYQALGDAALQVATVAGEYGLGLVTFPEGLNTGHKAAVSAGIPAGLVFRDLDGAGQAPDVIRRFLDNVAFRARTENGVIAVARVQPDTLQALLEWSLGSRAQSVSFAPVSAVLPR